MHPGALKILKFYPDLALHAKMTALPPSLVPAIDTFVPATSNLHKNPVFLLSLQSYINQSVIFTKV